jgi:hypothetical protein
MSGAWPRSRTCRVAKTSGPFRVPPPLQTCTSREPQARKPRHFSCRLAHNVAASSSAHQRKILLRGITEPDR